MTYGVVLHALARAGLASEAEQIMDTLQDEQRRRREYGGTAAPAVLVPSLTIYNTVLNAWANCRRRDLPIDMYSKGNSRVKPDSIMFNCAIMGQSGRICFPFDETRSFGFRLFRHLRILTTKFAPSGSLSRF